MVQIKTDQFEGPLDLLLTLIEEQKLDISTVALAKVTEQFLDYVKNLQVKNPINLADFLVIAAKLLVIKSKSLLPTLELGDEEEEAAFDLTEALLQYKKYKEVARHFRRIELRHTQSWTRDVDFSDRITFVPDPTITPQILSQSLQTLAMELKEIIKFPRQIMKEVVSISEKIAHIQQLISSQIETSLASLLKESKSKTEVIVTFLALLELTKQRIIQLEQTEHFADIIIKKHQLHGPSQA